VREDEEDRGSKKGVATKSRRSEPYNKELE